MLDRSAFEPMETVKHIWKGLSLPSEALDKIVLERTGHGFPSSFKIGHMAQASIGLSALAAALIDSQRQREGPSGGPPDLKKVTVQSHRACLEYISERLYTIDGEPPKTFSSPVGGLHRTSDGHVRIHDQFPNHRNGALKLLGLPESATRDEVDERLRKWTKLELEEAARGNNLAIYALRSYDEWDATPHARMLPDFPIRITKIGDEGARGLPPHMLRNGDRCLRGLRVLELSRVIAGPLAGKTLASHGADVLWVTSPKLPDLPALDRNFSRGKRTIQLDLTDAGDVETMRGLAERCDVFFQGYRPGAVASKGFSPAELARLRPGIVCANLSAFGPDGPWSDRRGFDSLVQTCSGMNVSEAEHFGAGEAARPMPCQALDHTAGYLMATGIAAALYRRAVEGGSWQVDVSLAAVMKYLRSLGQLPEKEGFAAADPVPSIDEVPDEYFEEKESGFGRLRALKEAVAVEGAMPGFDHMPKPLGSDKPEWL